MDLDLICMTRDCDAFGCLFGVMNFAGFRPVAVGRGLPADADARQGSGQRVLEPA